MLFLHQDKHHPPQTKRIVIRGRGGKRTLLCCRDQLHNPCMRKINQKKKPCTSNAEQSCRAQLLRASAGGQRLGMAEHGYVNR